MSSLIYFDNNATTRIDPAVAEAMHACWRAGHGNPASQHQSGQAARRLLEQTRDSLAHLLGAQNAGWRSDRLVLTSGGTESNNLALFGLAGAPPARIVVSTLEHPSVLAPALALARRGFDVQFAKARTDGTVDLEHLEDLLREPTRLVSVMMANNETGVLQPIAEVARLCAARGALLHIDAVQVAGKLPVAFATTGAATLSVTAHKLHGPVGIGALLIKSGVTLEPIQFGGFQQGGIRPGTEPLALAVGFQRALELWASESGQRRIRLQKLRDQFERTLTGQLPNLVIHGATASRLPHVSNISFIGLDRQTLMLALDRAGVACSTGSACASGSSEPSTTLRAMGLPASQIDSALRFSLSAQTTDEEVDTACQRILRVCNDLHLRTHTRKLPPTPRQSESEPL